MRAVKSVEEPRVRQIEGKDAHGKKWAAIPCVHSIPGKPGHAIFEITSPCSTYVVIC